VKSRIAYIEDKTDSMTGPAWIGRVVASKSGRSISYRGMRLFPVRGYKFNYVDWESGRKYWVSGCRKDGRDRLYGSLPIEIDEDVRAEYWTQIRNRPDQASRSRV
jgi:hypothetical protein